MKNTKTTNKNLTVTLSEMEYEDLDIIVHYFQSQSISSVSKSDVIKFMIMQFKTAIENDALEDVRRLINGLETRLPISEK